ncbi:hypothetical protein AAFC00_005154 [Neodothiora populina]|uniref:Rap-GAP domain-containing protein n=1 Tax=Neodothiora populina TaxID=2781224 RepID=A0ABR3PL12_9PEZI
MIRGVQLERRNSSFFGSPKPKSAASNPSVRTASQSRPRVPFDASPELLSRLLSGDTDLELAARVAKIRDTIDIIPVEDVQAVLDFCEKLISDEDLDVSNLGYTVIAKIAKHEECIPLHRVTFFTNFVRNNSADHYNRHQSCLLSFLTDQGRDIEGFEVHLPELISKLYGESRDTTSKGDFYRITTQDLGIELYDSLDVLSNIIKFNARFVSDDDVGNLITQMLRQGKDTAASKHLKVVSILDNLIAYTCIPRDVVSIISKLLSSWIGAAYVSCMQHDRGAEYKKRHEMMLEHVWMTFTRLLSTHLKDLAMDGLLESLHDDNEYNEQARGAAMLIHRSLTDMQTRRNVNFDLDKLLETLSTDIPGPDPIANSCVRLKLIRDLLQDQEMQAEFVAELDWTQLHMAIAVCATTPRLSRFDRDDHPSPGLACPDGDRVQQRQALTSAIIEQLENLQSISLTQSRALRKIALSAAQLLNERQTNRLIEAYHPSAFRISVGNWLPEINEIAKTYIRDEQMVLRWRQRALTVVNGALRKAQELGEPDAVRICGTIIVEALESEKNYTFRGNLVHCLISFVSEHLISREEGFKRVVDVLLQSARIETNAGHTDFAIYANDLLEHNDPPQQQYAGASFTGDDTFPTMLPEAGLVMLLMKSSMSHPLRAQMIYREIIGLINSRDSNRPPEATVMLMRGLFRIRSDIEHHIFYVASPAGERLAVALDRNSERPKLSMRRASLPFEREPSEITWKYGEISGLPDQPPTTISPLLRSDNPSAAEEEAEKDCNLDMGLWLRTITTIISEGADWETYSYVIVHLAAQLSNQSLFTEVIGDVRVLASTICQKVQMQTVLKPPEESGLRQGDVAFCLIEILTTIIGYHWHFPRSETERMVSTFIMGLTAWDITTVPCIHALTLCCYELPLSLSRDLVRIVEKMSTIVTKSDAAIHVLEFLAGMSRLELASRFHGDEIKTVFGVCFSYIEYARGKRHDESQLRGTNRSANPTRQGSVASGQRPSTEDIPQYVFAISYHVITFWFLTLKGDDRRKYLPWMESRLLSRDQAGNVEGEAIVTLDHLWRMTEGRNEDSASAVTPSGSTEDPTTKTWISEYCMLTVSIQPKATLAEMVERRCSGTDFLQLPVAAGSEATPEDVFTQHSLATAINGPFNSAAPPIPLPMTDATKRALGIFDRTSPIDYFKCGIIYVGESQTKEADILANVSGSPDYLLFINGMGSRIRLAGFRGNVAGLDTSEGAFDGPTTYQHTEGVTTLNYHITTLMPTNREHDPLCTRKKSHVGNDYVNVVFDNSGLLAGFDFHTFPSAFNYVYVVVTPEARQTFIQTRTRAARRAVSGSTGDGGKDDVVWFQDSWFRVQVLTREDFPDISSAAETKVVSGKALAAYVRNLVLNAEVFCRVWTNRGSGEYPSSWRARLGQIRQLRERVEKLEKEKEKEKEGNKNV